MAAVLFKYVISIRLARRDTNGGPAKPNCQYRKAMAIQGRSTTLCPNTRDKCASCNAHVDTMSAMVLWMSLFPSDLDIPHPCTRFIVSYWLAFPLSVAIITTPQMLLSLPCFYVPNYPGVRIPNSHRLKKSTTAKPRQTVLLYADDRKTTPQKTV
jgi:hypothetical protein